MFYSASTGGFYSAEIHGNAMPSDAVSITAEHYAELMAAQTAGKRIAYNAGAKPFRNQAEIDGRGR
jgi:hypothetical protein